jgi:hypothetical protein
MMQAHIQVNRAKQLDALSKNQTRPTHTAYQIVLTNQITATRMPSTIANSHGNAHQQPHGPQHQRDQSDDQFGDSSGQINSHPANNRPLTWFWWSRVHNPVNQ